MTDLLEILIYASEKAACIARSCCNSSETMLIAEKADGEANPRFNKDFKTIADVLAQESAKDFIVSHFPELKEHVRGEECSEIGGVNISLQDSLEKTVDLLASILPLDNAKSMAAAAHSEIKDLDYVKPSETLALLDLSDLGIWIDPIDATAEFISGVRGEAKEGCGLPCVTVLIGAYLRSTGTPIVGVVNQPFFNNGTGRIVWGVNNGTEKLFSHNAVGTNDKIILMSSAENEDVINKFKDMGWEIRNIPGAGHKLLQVALGEAAAYIVSKGTTFRWDTCAPHSIICAKGGDVVCFENHAQIKYNDPQNLDTQEYCNKNGIIAFSDPNVYDDILKVLGQ